MHTHTHTHTRLHVKCGQCNHLRERIAPHASHCLLQPTLTRRCCLAEREAKERRGGRKVHPAQRPHHRSRQPAMLLRPRQRQRTKRMGEKQQQRDLSDQRGPWEWKVSKVSKCTVVRHASCIPIGILYASVKFTAHPKTYPVPQKTE